MTRFAYVAHANPFVGHHVSDAIRLLRTTKSDLSFAFLFTQFQPRF